MEEIITERQASHKKLKDCIAFFIFGLCNNFGYVVMLTAAEDILYSYRTNNETTPNERNCTPISTGTVLLADIIPAFIIKFLSPFLPYNTNVRVFISCTIAALSFSIAASSKTIVILGVILTSFSSGLGEPTFLYYSTFYDKNTISTWSSGTGAAGIVGALSYTLLRQIGLSSYNTLIIMVIVPAIELFVYMTLLSLPTIRLSFNRRPVAQEDGDDENEPLINADLDRIQTTGLTFEDKIALIPHLFIYIIPLLSVYFFEYFINQGLFELVVFKDIFLTKEQQYHWFQVTYQIGVFVARSSVNVIQIKHTWIMAIVQGIIATFFLSEAIFLYVPSIWIILVIIFIEGLQGGLAYVNTFYRISQEVMPEYRAYAMNVVSISDSLGIILAGFFAIFAHNWICNLPISTNV